MVPNHQPDRDVQSMEKPWDTPEGLDGKEMVGVPYLCWLILTIEDHINDISGAKVSHLNGDGKREEKNMLKEITLLRVIPTMSFIHFVTGKSSDILSGISSGILSGISSGILFGILSGISSGISSDILSGIVSGKHSGPLSDIPSGTCPGHSTTHARVCK